jgi:hypothetical protein
MDFFDPVHVGKMAQPNQDFAEVGLVSVSDCQILGLSATDSAW